MLKILCENLLILTSRIESILSNPNAQWCDEDREVLISIHEILIKIENKISLK